MQQLAQRHGLSTDAVTHMLIAVYNGNGTMAQFSHPEFSGSGQWMRGGMTMVSDMFNNQLKNRVDSLCNDLANELANHQQTPFSGSSQSQSQNGNYSQSQAAGAVGSSNSLFEPDARSNWWPSELGTPAAIGSQNNLSYAYFPNSRRLAVNSGGDIWLYDTLEHQIGGFSQQQGSSGGISFASQFGTVSLATLPVVSRNGVATQPPEIPSPPVQGVVQEQPLAQPPTEIVRSPESRPTQAPAAELTNVVASQPGHQANRQEILDTLDQLGGLLKKGYLSESEFASKKAELLSRL